MTQQIGRKFDSGKPEFSLVPPHALRATAEVLTFGAKKYEVDNWKFVENGAYRYKNAAMRHVNSYLSGEKIDPESGLHHLAHAVCCLMFILDADESGIPLAPPKRPAPNFQVPDMNYAFSFNPENSVYQNSHPSVNTQ